MGNVYTTLLKTKAMISITAKSTSENQSSEIDGGHKAAVILNMAKVADRSDQVVGQHDYSSNRTNASIVDELQCGLRACLGRNTSGNNTPGNTTVGFSMVWDWLRHGIQHLRAYDIYDTYCNAMSWFPWRHWAIWYCTSEGDDTITQPDDGRVLTKLLKLDNYDQSEAVRGRHYTFTVPACVLGLRHHHDVQNLWLHYHDFHGPHTLRIEREIQSQSFEKSKSVPNWLEQLDQSSHFKHIFEIRITLPFSSQLRRWRS